MYSYLDIGTYLNIFFKSEVEEQTLEFFSVTDNFLDFYTLGQGNEGGKKQTQTQ